MYLFSRIGYLSQARLADGHNTAIEVAEMATGITGIPIAVYIPRYGAPTNGVMWSYRADTQAQISELGNILVADESYQKWLDRNVDLLEGSPSDGLVRIVSASNIAPAPRTFYCVTSATAANGKIAEAFAVGVKAEQHVAAATGMTTIFASLVYGAFGAVNWFVGCDAASDLDVYADMQMNDVGFQTMVAEAGAVFLPGSGQVSLIERIH